MCDEPVVFYLKFFLSCWITFSFDEENFVSDCSISWNLTVEINGEENEKLRICL